MVAMQSDMLMSVVPSWRLESHPLLSICVVYRPLAGVNQQQESVSLHKVES
jgi:hypothetical protein